MHMRINRFSVLAATTTAAAIAVLVVPARAQFGIAGNRRAAGTNFQDLQELAKEKAAREEGGGGAAAGAGGAGGVAGIGNMQDLLKGVMDNPEYMKQFGGMAEQFGSQFGEALEQMMKMSPEELAAQMEQAMKLMTDGDMVENVVNQKDEIIKSLEASGAVPPEELERYKADPAYFELKMRESFAQMGELFENPEHVAKTAEALQGIAKLMDDPAALNEMMEGMSDIMSSLQDDDQIEEARQKFLSGDFGEIPAFKEMFDTPTMREILQDPVKWRETVKGGYKDMMATMGTDGLGKEGGILDGLLDGRMLDDARDEL